MKKCKVILVLLSFVLISGGFTKVVFADDVIRVGYINYNGFIEKDKNKKFDGYGVKYLNEISKYTGWRYEYVYDTWTNCLEKLKTGEIDLICTSQYTEERDKSYKFSKYPIGYELSILYVSKDNKNIYYDDKEAFNGMRVGMIDGSFQNKLFEKYAKENSFTYDAVMYKSDSEVTKALNEGKVDAIAVGNLSWHDDLKVVAKFGVDPFYFITSEKNNAIMKNIDLAIDKIKIDNPYFESELYRKYDSISIIESVDSVEQKFNWNLFFEEYLFIITIILFILSALVVRIWEINRRKVIKARHYDTLTDSYNLNYLEEEGPKILKKYGIDGYYFIKFDISRFKSINHYYGVNIGDDVLKKIASEGRKKTKDGEIFARISEDNFIVLAKLGDDLSDLSEFLKGLEGIKFGVNLGLQLKFKAGLYKVEDKDEPISIMIDKASMAHRSIKGNHKLNYAIYNDKIEKKVLLESKIEVEMESALQNKEFQVYLQPKVDLSTLKILGAEALIRWVKKDGTIVYPNQFIPIFETNGFIEKIDLFVLEEVCKYLCCRKENRESLCSIAINQSRQLLTNPNYINLIFEILDKYEIDSSLIEIEITETLYIENKDILLKAIEKLHERGIKLSIDDFGSGYSSLNLITEIPADILKIDRAFLVYSEESEVKNKVIKKVVQLAHELDMKVVCEGVETSKQEEFLCDIGCDMAQGYLYSKPIQIPEFESLILL